MNAAMKKSIDRDVTGKVFDFYDGKVIPPDDHYLISQFISTNETLRRHLIINDKNIIGALFVGSDGHFHVISLPEVGMDGQIYRTMGTSPTQYVPIKLPPDSLKDIITLIECNYDNDSEEDFTLFKVEAIKADKRTKLLFTIKDNQKLIRTPRMIPLCGYHSVDGGALNDEKVRESIVKLHPAMDTWLKSCDSWLESSSLEENAQIKSAGKYHHFDDLAPDGLFMIHYITELDARDQKDHLIHDIDKQLAIIAAKNHSEYYKIFLEHRPTSTINITSDTTAVELLNNEDPTDKDDKTIATMKQVRSP